MVLRKEIKFTTGAPKELAAIGNLPDTFWMAELSKGAGKGRALSSDPLLRAHLSAPAEELAPYDDNDFHGCDDCNDIANVGGDDDDDGDDDFHGCDDCNEVDDVADVDDVGDVGAPLEDED